MQSCHDAIRSEIDANNNAVFGVYSAVLAFEVQTITKFTVIKQVIIILSFASKTAACMCKKYIARCIG